MRKLFQGHIFKSLIPPGLSSIDIWTSVFGIWLLPLCITAAIQKLTLNLLIHVFLKVTETQLRGLTVATGRIPTSGARPWGPSATRELIEVTTWVSPPIHRRQDATGSRSTLISPAHELVLRLVSNTGVVILSKCTKHKAFALLGSYAV